MSKKVAVYHGACVDGSTAAAVFKMCFKDVELIPIKSRIHEEAKEEAIELAKKHGSELFVLDNHFFVKDYLNEGLKLTVLDHHISGYEELKALEKENPNLSYIFDNNKSGASLAWAHFFKGKEIPKFIWHVEDGDIWKMEDRYHTDLVNTYASIYMDNIDKYIEMINSDIEEIYKIAKPIYEYREALIDYYIRNAQALHLKIGEHVIKAYNVASIRPVVSQFGNIVSEKTKETIVMFKIFGDHVNLSFRSAGDFKPSARELAVFLGGGGHERASGATMPLKDFIENLQDIK